MITKADSNTSFSQKLKAGWPKQDLMNYYALSDVQYDKVLASLDVIRNDERNKAGKAV
jgi:hypothetical protein